MTTNTDLNEALIKRQAGAFDLDSIFLLDLSRLNLRSLHASLSLCSSLHTLSLSHNNLSNNALSVLNPATLPRLRKLDISFNSFTSLASLPSFIHLTHLYAQGNRLDSDMNSSGLNELSRKSVGHSLVVLTLKDKDSRYNTVTQQPSYRASMMQLFPSLERLDGLRIRVGNGANNPLLAANNNKDIGREQEALNDALEAVFQRTEKYSSRNAAAASSSDFAMLVKAEEAKLEKRKKEDWLPMVSSSSNSNMNALTPADVERQLAPTLNGFRDKMKECNKLLKDEADKLIAEIEKKYATAIAKEKHDSSGATNDVIDDEAATSSTTNNNSSDFGTFGGDED